MVTAGTADRSRPATGGWRRLLWYYAAPAVAVVAAVYLLARLQAGAEQAATELARSVRLGTAFGAGMVACVNPCGFIMLPTYLSLQLGTQESGYRAAPRLRRMLAAVRIAAAATAGFVAVVAPVGAVVALAGQALGPILPYAATATGAGMAALALWLLITGRKIGIAAASRVHVTPRRNTGNALLFGMSYAIASLSCALPIFLLVVSTALTAGGLLITLAQFASYALGMGAVITAVTLGAALLRDTLAQRLRALLPFANHVGVLFLLGAGVYLVYYWVAVTPVAF